MTSFEKVHAFRARQRDCTYGAPEDYKRRCKLEKNSVEWLKFYLEESFPLNFGKIHLDYIEDLDYIAEHGGWKAIVLPRGSGKTTIAEGFALKCLLSGQSNYMVMIAAKANFAKAMIETFKTWLLYNDKIAADYPEVCMPMRHTKGIPQAMKTLTAFGKPVNLSWTANKIVLPNTPRIEKGQPIKSVSENSIIDSDGITGSINGRKHDTPDGRTVRPDLCIVDDPQTPESARSMEQTRARMSAIKASIAGLAGPGKDMRIIVPCTIMEPGDLADEISNPELTPDFLGERHPFFISMPENMELWEKYNEVRKEGLADRDCGKAAKAFYKKNRKALDKGAVVSWPERCGDNAINGIQWGMDAYFRLGPKAFQTELQGAPLPREEMIRITKDHVKNVETDLSRWVVPADHFVTTAFIDCNPRTSGLHWTVCSFGKNMESHICAYGVFPERGTLVPEGASDAQEDALLFEGLRKVCESLKKANITTTDSRSSKIDLMMIDAGYKFEVVVKFVQAGRFPFQLAVSRGRASTKYLDVGRDVLKTMQNIHLRKNPKNERYLSHNADAVREIVHRAFVAGKDVPGGIGLHKVPPHHDNFAEHIVAMRLIDKAEGDKCTLYKWGKLPGSEEHWLDCIVGCFAGAFWLGMTSDSSAVNRKKKNRKTRFENKNSQNIRSKKNETGTEKEKKIQSCKKRKTCKT